LSDEVIPGGDESNGRDVRLWLVGQTFRRTRKLKLIFLAD
jgi:hypothetical protein